MVDMSFAVGDRVKICSKPLSLLKSHADQKAEIVKKGFGNEYLIRINGSNWWAKEYDFEEEKKEPLPFSVIEKIENLPQFKQN